MNGYDFEIFINRPIFATVIAIVMVLVGLVTIYTLPVAQFPDITPPTVQVTAVYPGASAETVAKTVGVPIEEQVNGVDGMIYMSSSSSSSGQYTLTVTFEVGTDIDMATVLVQNRVNIAQGNLPEAVIQQGIITKKQSTNIVMFLALESDNPLYNSLYLSNYAKLNITDELSRLPGVGGVTVFGADNYSMRIWLDPELMRIRSLTPADVYSAIQAQIWRCRPVVWDNLLRIRTRLSSLHWFRKVAFLRRRSSDGSSSSRCPAGNI